MLQYINITLIPMSHTGDAAIIILVDIEEQRLFQICQNSPKIGRKVWSCDKKISKHLSLLMFLYCPIRLNLNKTRSGWDFPMNW